MNQLARVSAESIGSAQCVSVQKFADGMYNKAYLMTMSDGQQVVAKVPNPNAGITHFTTASEVATLDFARNVLGTPAPQIYAWNSRAASSPVGAEYIIMERVPGVPISTLWGHMTLTQKLKILLAITDYQRKWSNVSFSHFGCLYYSQDVKGAPNTSYVKDGQRINESPFTVGPAAGRDWADAGRSGLNCERGPFGNVSQYLAMVGTRETIAIHSLQPPKQIAILCGPHLYRPDAAKKLAALSWYQQMIDFLVPEDPSLNAAHLWHNDLHGDNIFVDPTNPEKITGIIDWQSTQILPLFNHRADPAFLDHDGLEPETLERPPNPDLTGLSNEERASRMEDFSRQAVFIAWRRLMQNKNPVLYRSVEFRNTAPYGLIFLARRMFEYGEAHFRSLTVDMKETWDELPAARKGRQFPFDFTLSEIDAIKSDSDAAIAGTELVEDMQTRMGSLWPDKGIVAHDEYDAAKALLREIKAEILEALAETKEERAEFERHWPFDD